MIKDLVKDLKKEITELKKEITELKEVVEELRCECNNHQIAINELLVDSKPKVYISGWHDLRVKYYSCGKMHYDVLDNCTNYRNVKIKSQKIIQKNNSVYVIEFVFEGETKKHYATIDFCKEKSVFV